MNVTIKLCEAGFKAQSQAESAALVLKSCLPVTDTRRLVGNNPAMTSESLVRTLEGFLAGSRDAVVLEEGAVAFDLARAQYSISGERGKCLLHLWSTVRNTVRRGRLAEIN